jgi:hypothetical protein
MHRYICTALQQSSVGALLSTSAAKNTAESLQLQQIMPNMFQVTVFEA